MGLFWGKQKDEMDVKASDDVRNQNTEGRSSVNDPHEKQVKRILHVRGYIDERIGLERTLAAAGLPACSFSHILLNGTNLIEQSETHTFDESDIVTEVYFFPIPDEYLSSVYPHLPVNSSFRDSPHEPHSFRGRDDRSCVNDVDRNRSSSYIVQDSQTNVEVINYDDIQNCTAHTVNERANEIDRSRQNSKNVDTHRIDGDFNNSYDSRFQSNCARDNEKNFYGSHKYSDQGVHPAAIAINHDGCRKRSHEDSHVSPYRPKTTCEESCVSSERCMSKTCNEVKRPRIDTEISDEHSQPGVAPGFRAHQPVDPTSSRSEIWINRDPSRCVVRSPIPEDLTLNTDEDFRQFANLNRNIYGSTEASLSCEESFDRNGALTRCTSTTVNCHDLHSRRMSSISDDTQRKHDENRCETRLCCPVPDQRFRAAARESSPITENNFHQRLRVAMEMCGVQPLIHDSSPSKVSRKRSSEDGSETIVSVKRRRANFDSRHTDD